MKRPSTLRNVGLRANTRPRITFLFFSQWKNHQRWKPIAIQKKKGWKLLNSISGGRGQGAVCVLTPAQEMRRERQTFTETAWASEENDAKALAQMFIFAPKWNALFFKVCILHWWGCRAIGIQIHYWGARKLVKPPCRTTVFIQWQDLKLHFPIVLTISHPGLSFIYILCIQNDICSLQHCLYQ